MFLFKYRLREKYSELLVKIYQFCYTYKILKTSQIRTELVFMQSF